jgi:DeoR family fructose operon transcriptional repressor
VTNALSHAVRLAKRGFNVYIIGGQIKSITEAIIDSEAIISLTKYNFTKGFFGTNGINIGSGLTTPDVREADIKKFAMSRCAKKYVLCDSSKFNKISKATFAMPGDVTIITDKTPDDFKDYFKDYKIKEAQNI